MHALKRTAKKKENKNLLIHQARRDPGPPAVALAKAMGHKVTCQSITKTTLLELGAENVTNQSFATFEDDSRNVFDAVLFLYLPPPNALQKSSRNLKRG